MCALAVLFVFGLVVYLDYDSSLNTLVNSTVQVPAVWEKISSTDKKIQPYDYNHTFILNIESINRSTYYKVLINCYYVVFTNVNQKNQNSNMEAGIIDIEGVEVLYEKNTVFDTDEFKKIKNLYRSYIFQKEGKFYIVRFGFFPKNSTDYGVINSSSVLFDETLKSIIRTI